MSAGDSNYKVGPGKPPLQTRFQKGQSGNPSGKPGPAKLARQRFQRALHAALSEGSDVLRHWERGNNLEFMARRLTRDAIDGRLPALKFILSELDKEVAGGEPACADEAARGDEAFQGKEGEAKHGNEAKERSAGANAAEPPPMPDYALWRKSNPG